MKAIVIYDSQWGNTEKIAQAIGRGIEGDVKVVKVLDAGTEDIADCPLVFIGSPTQGGRQTTAVKNFMDKISPDMMKDKRFAAFDTRLKNIMVRMFGFAAPRIGEAIKEKGGNVAAQPEGFFVKSTKGPLLEGEEERAAAWAKSLVAGEPSG